jgi:transportin-1
MGKYPIPVTDERSLSKRLTHLPRKLTSALTFVLLCRMLEGMGPNFEKLVKSNVRYADSFLPMIHNLCQSDSAGVRMSAFALIGDLARNTPGLLEPGISQLMRELIECIDPIHPVSWDQCFNVCNSLRHWCPH